MVAIALKTCGTMNEWVPNRGSSVWPASARRAADATARLARAAGLLLAVLVCCALTLFSVAATAQVQTGPSGATYRFDSGDTLTIHVAGQDELSADVIVDISGNITLPLIGRTPVRGLDSSGVELMILTRLRTKNLLKDPRVTVWIKEMRPVTVLGDVRTPGVYPYRSFSIVKNAIAMAGGFGTQVQIRVDEVLQAAQAVRELQLERTAMLLRQARLRAQLENKTSFEVPASLANAPAEVISQLVNEEQAVLKSRVGNLNEQVRVLLQQLDYNNEQIKTLEQQAEVGDEQQRLFAEQLKRFQDLRQRGFASEKRGFELRRDDNNQRTLALRMAAERARFRGDTTTVEIRIKDMRSQFEQLTLQDLTTVGDRLRKLTIEIPSAMAIYQQRLSQAGSSGFDEPLRSIVIVRLKNGEPETIVASEMTKLQPGDLVEVKTLMQPIVSGGRNLIGMHHSAPSQREKTGVLADLPR